MVISRAVYVAGVLAGFVGLACATTSPGAAVENPSAVNVVPASTLGVGDVFEVRVFSEPDLSGTYRIDSDGSIAMPLAGRVDVAGLTPNAISIALESLLSSYLKSPQVSVFVTEFNSKKIYVLGEVKSPGTFVYETGMTVVQAITLAGGFDSLAEKNGTYVTRIVAGKEQQIEIPVEDIGEGRAKNFSLVPGDIVYVPESLF
ncbi:MAG: polysaccharide biosynthesis/export family protein [Myxococcota bacterium]